MGREILSYIKYSVANTHRLQSGVGYTPQSLALVSSKEMYVFCNGSSPNHILKIDDKGKFEILTGDTYGHANGSTYCPKNDLFYVTAYQSSAGYYAAYAVDRKTFKIKFTVRLDMSCTGIAYDRTNEKFYVSNTSGIGIYTYDSFAQGGSASRIKYITKKFQDERAHQDVGGIDGTILVVMSVEGSTADSGKVAYVDLYDSESGKYKGSWAFRYGELESVAIDETGLVHAIRAVTRSYIKTGLKFGEGFSGVINTSGGTTLGVHADRLYSSDNFTFVDANYKEEEKPKSPSDSLKEIISSIDFSELAAIPDTYKNVSIIASGKLDNSKLRKTKVNGELVGNPFPVALNPVEAPFIQLTIGDYTFGTYDSTKYDKYPNYIDSINVIKTNGSMNEYTINLVHQIRPGSNPNFIDEILSKNGYNKIKIKYGDANSDVKFIDENALLIGVSESFDFVNCNVKYTLKATSNAISIASRKRTFKSVTDKPSNIIRNLLYNDSNNDLLDAFPKMRDKNFVANNNLIPNNDKVLTVEAFKDINAVTYLKNLVAAMQNSSDTKNSNYMLLIEDGYFSIKSINSSYSYDASLYEVNINFPDNNQVFSFNINTNYSWPIAYDYSNKISNYNYEIGSNGEIDTYKDTSSQLLEFSSQMQNSINANWWKQVTDFPISATLTCRGLLSPQLLLSYVKINCIYYGVNRITSGIYIITGQQDSLSGGGYKTTLSLLRVAGPKEHLTVNGSVKT